jgi:hypothetical protein
LSPLHNHARKPSRITFTIATATVVAATALTVGMTAQAASPAAQAVHTVARQASGLNAAVLARYAPPDRQLQALHASAALGQVRRAAAEARMAAQRAAVQRAAAQRAAARLAAANAAAASAAAAKATASATPAAQPATAPVTAAASGNPQQVALAMLGSFGWPSSQFSCLVSLWDRESGWNIYASNPSSGAYGIPQALPGSKMASAGPDWATDAATQIRWGLGYIQQVYGSPCAAWDHSQAVGWY